MLLIVLSFSQILPDIFGLSTLNECSVVVRKGGPKEESQTRENGDCDDVFHMLILYHTSAMVKHFLENIFVFFGTSFARANLMPKLFSRLAHGLLGTPLMGDAGPPAPPQWGVFPLVCGPPRRKV